MNNYIAPKASVVEFDVANIILVSGGVAEPHEELEKWGSEVVKINSNDVNLYR